MDARAGKVQYRAACKGDYARPQIRSSVSYLTISESVLDRSSLWTNDLRSAYSKTGWKRFDETAKPYSADEVRQYRSSWQ